MKKQSIPAKFKTISIHSALNGTLKISAAILLTCLVVACPDSPLDPPTLTTSNVIAITSSAAISGGNITADGGGEITKRGLCWSTMQNPTIDDVTSQSGSGEGSFTCNINGLTSNTTYYVKAYASNSKETGYGEEKSFTTPPTASDVDGNVYSTVVIGTQTWMAENLKIKHYRNGDPITYIAEGQEWGATEEGEYCDYDLLGTLEDAYGLFYNWYAVADSRNIAPEGWHVPSDDEWTVLIDFLGGIEVAGEKMRESGFVHWWGEEAGGVSGTNVSGFTALGAGFYGDDHGKWEARIWSSTEEEGSDLIKYLFLDLGNLMLRAHDPKTSGYSIRLVKD